MSGEVRRWDGNETEGMQDDGLAASPSEGPGRQRRNWPTGRRAGTTPNGSGCKSRWTRRPCSSSMRSPDGPASPGA
jgi:hypothetical protein